MQTRAAGLATAPAARHLHRVKHTPCHTHANTHTCQTHIVPCVGAILPRQAHMAAQRAQGPVWDPASREYLLPYSAQRKVFQVRVYACVRVRVRVRVERGFQPALAVPAHSGDDGGAAARPTR
jgi:hypothetical protein